MGSAKKGVDLAIAAVFCAAISVPACVGIVRRFPADTGAEYRLPAPFPAMTLGALPAFPRAFEYWFADHFAFRGYLVRLSSLLRVRVGVSSSPLVARGKDGWLFYTGDYADLQFRRVLPLTDGEVAAWRWLLELRRDWLAARGVHYLFVFNPNKESIYPEAMPFPTARLPLPSRLEQVLDDLRERSSVTVLDTSFAVEKARWGGQVVFNHTDSHWNGLGRYAAYAAIASRLHDWFDVIEPADIATFDVKRSLSVGGDLSRLMGLPLDLPEKVKIEVTSKKPRATLVSVVNGVPGTINDPLAYEVSDPSLPRALILGDSFIRSLVEPLAEHFRRTVYLPLDELSSDLIAREAPDVVIDGWLERHFLTHYPRPPKEAGPSFPLRMDLPHPPGIEIMPRDSWQPHDVSLSGSNSLVSIGIDPWLRVEPTAFAATGGQDIWVELTARNNGPPAVLMAQFFFAAGGALLWEGASVHFPILADGLRHSYDVRPSVSPEWSGRIDLLRLDFPVPAPGNIYTVHSVELVQPEARPRTNR